MRSLGLLWALLLLAPAATALGPLEGVAVDARLEEPVLDDVARETSLLNRITDRLHDPEGVTQDVVVEDLLAGSLELLGVPPRPARLNIPDEGEGGDAFKFANLVDDVDGDGVRDLLVHEWFGTSRIVTVSGQDGHELWSEDNRLYFMFWGRAGDPILWPLDNVFPTKDLNNDGVGDVFAFGYDIQFFIVFCAGTITLTGEYRALDGKTGQVLWSEPFLSTIIIQGCVPPWEVIYLNFPTGQYYMDAPTGPRVVWKNMDIHAVIVPCGSAINVIDHVHLIEAEKQGHHKWDRVILPSESPEHAAFGWITGATELADAGEFEVLVDRLYFYQPQYCEGNNPITRDPLYRIGRGMSVLALQGETGENLWHSMVFEDPPIRANLPVEEAFPVLIWTYGQLRGDLNRDGIDDPMATFLTQDSTSPSTVNGMFKTNLVPLNGKTGEKLWREDEKTGPRKYMGWGYAANLSPPGGAAGFVAVGTVDIPTRPPPGGRFPPKDIHLAVLNASTGAQVWGVDQRFSQDSYLSYELSLAQYLQALAPHDWDGDGVKDLVTPAQYRKPGGRNQTLLATAEHSYQIFSGATGQVLYRVQLWGSNGQIVACQADGADLTIAHGHGRRFDMSRFNLTTGQAAWRQPVYNDPRLRPATAGVDLIFFYGHCEDDAARTMVNVNLATFAIGAGFELHPILGVAKPLLQELVWLDPELLGNPPLKPSFVTLPAVPKETSLWSSTWVLVLAPIVPGAIGGVALSLLTRKKGLRGPP